MSGNGRSSEKWGSKIGVILAVAGSAVGLGNFLRFPGQAAANGGGAFMIPYFISFLIVGIPICWAEWTMGRYGGKFGFNSSPGIFSVLWRHNLGKYTGALALLIPIIIYMYYVYLESWCLAYAYKYLTGELDLGKNPAVYNDFFKDLTGLRSNGAVFHDGIQEIFWFFVVTFIVNFFFIYRGLSKGIEAFCKFAMPLLIVAAVVVVVRVLSFPEQPFPVPWQNGLAKAIPESDWDTLRAIAVDPETTTDAMKDAVSDTLNGYFDAIARKDPGFDSDIPIIPPAGFDATPAGYAVAMAELRAGATGTQYEEWIVHTRDALDRNSKIALQHLERRQFNAKRDRNAHVGHYQERIADLRRSVSRPVNEEAIARVEADIQAVEAQHARIIEQIMAERKNLLESTGEPMPSLVAQIESVKSDPPLENVSEIQRRSAALAVSALPRTVFNGLGYMWNPDFSELGNMKVWLAAAGQIFFSLSVGFGIILTYSSYLRRDDDVVLSGLTASATNEFCEVVLGGLVAIPATFLFLGSAMTLDVISQGSTFSLGFNTLPTVFANMPAGRWFGAIWFGLLFLAAVTSSLSMLQPGIAFLEEGFGLKRRASVTALGLMTASGSLSVIYFSGDAVALSTMDDWVGTVAIFILATVEVILFGWVVGIDRGFEEAHRGANLRIPSIFKFILKFVTPLFLLVIFAGWLVQSFWDKIEALQEKPVALMTMVNMGIVLLFLVLLVNLAGERWREYGMGTKEVDQ